MGAQPNRQVVRRVEGDAVSELADMLNSVAIIAIVAMMIYHIRGHQ